MHFAVEKRKVAMKVGDLVAGRARRKSVGIVFKILRNHEADPYICRFRVLWPVQGLQWECLDDLEVINECR